MQNHIFSDYADFFKLATGHRPFPYQSRLANAQQLPWVLDVPTGSGKTAGAILAWLWRRRFHPDENVRRQTSRRLVYCLPMRVLVEQTIKSSKDMLARVGLLTDQPSDLDKIAVHSLMGGDLDETWDLYPEADAILVGTQDMLLSRALNRGYAMSRYRWPIQFGLINNDSLWVLDEVQLMGTGLATTAQLQGFRNRFQSFGPSHSLWVSATVDYKSLLTVDSPLAGRQDVPKLTLGPDDLTDPKLKERHNSRKSLRKARTSLDEKGRKDYASALAQEVLAAHQPNTLTIVIVNQVQRAQDIYVSLKKLAEKRYLSKTDFGERPDLVLIHSRFRPGDRRRNMDRLLSPLGSAGRILVATQAIEAGVDVSARTMFTELAPWPSLVQRFGRCNRYGEYNATSATVYWIDMETRQKGGQLALPYPGKEMDWARVQLEGLTEVGPSALSLVSYESHDEPDHILRQKDLLDLFDTTPDLSGFDLDVSRFIRETGDSDVLVFWGEWEGDKPDSLIPRSIDACSVDIYKVRDFLKDNPAWIWDGLEDTWVQVRKDKIFAGITMLLPSAAGGYSEDLGWTGDIKDKPQVLRLGSDQADGAIRLDAMDLDQETGIGRFETLVDHTNRVVMEATNLQECLGNLATYAASKQIQTANSGLPTLPWQDLFAAARWHDAGKIHEAFQNMLLTGLADDSPRRQAGPWAKSEKTTTRGRYWTTDPRGQKVERRHFRHELASALAMLQHSQGDLAAYLVAAHHGKVRVSIRSLPGERIPPDGRRFARGVWEGDQLPRTDLGDGVSLPQITLDLSYVELGMGPRGKSWLERVLSLRNAFGPFRLAYLEALLRIADWRGSK